MSSKIENIRAEIRVMRRMFNSMLDDLETELGKIKEKPLSAKNSIEVRNDLKDYQKIKTAELTVPVIYADVLYYAPGELGSGSDIGREGAYVYYSPESISDPEYLETVKRSAISVGTHEKNTGEYNRDVDGWPVKVWYDEAQKCVMVTGVVHGEENVAYVEKHKKDKGFGSSAYIDFLGVKKEEGVSSTGNKYTAKTTKLVNNHIALLPNIRDSKNVILALNALNEDIMALNERKVINNIIKKYKYGGIDYSIEEIQGKDFRTYKMRIGDEKHGYSFFRENDAIETAIADIKKYYLIKKAKNSTEVKNVKEEIKSALNEIEDEKKKASELEDTKNALKVANEKIAELETKNKAYEGKETKEEEAEEKKVEAGNAEDKEDESFNAKNALPSQDLIKDISEFSGIQFTKTPTVFQLASVVGIKGKSFDETLSALNAKRQEIKGKSPEAKNTSGKSEPASFDDLLAAM